MKACDVPNTFRLIAVLLESVFVSQCQLLSASRFLPKDGFLYHEQFQCLKPLFHKDLRPFKKVNDHTLNPKP
jgi:hypothetical protein